MKKYAFLVVAILALLVFASGCTSTNSYSSNGISFNYPTSWQQLSTNGTLNIAAVADPNSKDNSTGSANTLAIIQSEPLPSGQDVKAVYDATYSQYAASDPTYKSISDTTTTVDGVTAYVNTHTVDVDGVTKQEEAVWFSKNGNVYIILCGALPSDFAAQQDNFNMIINSFKVQ